MIPLDFTGDEIGIGVGLSVDRGVGKGQRGGEEGEREEEEEHVGRKAVEVAAGHGCWSSDYKDLDRAETGESFQTMIERMRGEICNEAMRLGFLRMGTKMREREREE